VQASRGKIDSREQKKTSLAIRNDLAFLKNAFRKIEENQTANDTKTTTD
jgi:hypothetical protein